MKEPKIIKHTGVFQSMIDKYHKYTSKILAKRKISESLTNHILKDLDQVKNKEYFRDEDYFINEIKTENEIKKKIEQSKINLQKKLKIANLKVYKNKISKNIFFYYKEYVNGKNKNKDKNIKMIGKGFEDKKRIISPKSVLSINSAKKSNNSFRKYSVPNLILPNIYSANDEHQEDNKNIFKTIPTEEVNYAIQNKNYDRIKYSGRRRVPNYLSYERNNFNQINEEYLLKKLHHPVHNLLLDIKLPLVTNKIVNKLNEATDISKSISRDINHISNEQKTTAENERNLIRFMNNLF